MTAVSPRSEDTQLERVWGDLIARVAQRDQDALGRLYECTSPFVFGLILRIVRDRAAAEDVALDVYMQVWKAAGQYAADRGAPSSWLLMLARSRALDWLRSRTRRSQEREDSLDAGVALAEPGPGPEETAMESRRRRMIQAALALLTPEQRQSIELAFFSGMSHTEVASRLGVPLGTIKGRIRVGMLRLRELLQPYAEAL